MKRHWSHIVFMVSFLSVGIAEAQELDYGRYEELFGEPVTMSATGKPERISDTPVVMDVITADDIQRSGARDIPTLLQRLARVDVTHSSSGAEDVGIGGFIQPLRSRIMVLINGRQVYFDGFGEVFWSSLPVELDEIRQIEVIKGAQSALYGFNAVDGVVNIVTFDPVDDQINSARTRLGNHALREFSATTTQRLAEGAGVRLSVADDHAHDDGIVNETPANMAYRKDPNRRAASFDAGATLPDDSRINLEGSHTDSTQRLIANSLFFDTRIVTNSIKGSYTSETELGRLNGTATYTDLNMPWVQAQPLGPFTLDDRTAVAQFSDVFKLGADDSFRLGIEGRHDRMLAPGVTGGALTGDLGAGSAMWEHAFSPTISAVNSVRYDYFKLGRTHGGALAPGDIFTNADFDRSIEGTSVNSSLIDKVTDDDSLRLEFARGLKLPSLTNLGQLERFLPAYSPSARTTTYYYGNPNLQASAVYDYQAGWDHRIQELDATSRLIVFHDMTMSVIGSPISILNRSPAELSIMSTGTVTNGIELDLQHKVREGWNWGTNYTYQRMHEHYNWGLRDASPDHKANINLGYRWGQWEGDLYTTYVSATKGTVITAGPPVTSTAVRLPSHAILSPRIGWHPLDNLTVELVGENLWPYRDILPQKQETSAYISVKISY
jgi:iron complex outermembrane receptor protein